MRQPDQKETPGLGDGFGRAAEEKENEAGPVVLLQKRIVWQSFLLVFVRGSSLLESASSRDRRSTENRARCWMEDRPGPLPKKRP